MLMVWLEIDEQKKDMYRDIEDLYRVLQIELPTSTVVFLYPLIVISTTCGTHKVKPQSDIPGPRAGLAKDQVPQTSKDWAGFLPQIFTNVVEQSHFPGLATA